MTQEKTGLKGFTKEALEALSRARGEPEWLLGRRLEAWHIFQETPMPTVNDELWRRTPIADLELDAYTPFNPAGQRVDRLGALPQALRRLYHDGLQVQEGGLVVQRNGATAYAALQDELGRQGVLLCSLEEAVREHPELVEPYLATEAVPATEGKFEALSAAFWSGGVFVYVPRGVEVTLPLRAIGWMDDPSAALITRNLVVAEANSRVDLVDQTASQTPEGGRPLTVGAVEIQAVQGARVNYLSLQDWDRSVWDFTSKRALVERDATVNWLVGTFGARLTKSMVGSTLRGFGANTLMLGLFFSEAGQHLDMDTRQVHQRGHATSDLLFKGATAPGGRSIYYGLIQVDPDAQRTDAYQANRTLLLGDKARHDSIPSLEIRANDVRCTHGSTTGRVDEEMIFYARTRGISRAQAAQMIVEAFFQDVIDRVPVEAVRAELRSLVTEKLYRSLGRAN